MIVCFNFSGLQWDSEDRRLDFLFRMYDLDRDGFISNGELFQVKSYDSANLIKGQLISKGLFGVFVID